MGGDVVRAGGRLGLGMDSRRGCGAADGIGNTEIVDMQIVHTGGILVND